VAKQTIRDLELAGKRVFIRVDFNVPMSDGAIADDTRIRASLPTITYALERVGTGCVVLASHLGRPKGRRDPGASLRPVAERLGALVGRPVVFAEDCVGEAARAAIARAGPGGLVLLENLRFHPGEEQNDAAFAAQLAELADVYVNDAFGTAHRAHASTAGMVRLVPQAGAGFLMARELEFLGRALEAPERPFVALLGGAKVSGKLEVIENLLGKVDALAIGGAMAYTFLKARGLPVGRSRVEDELVETARAIERRAAERGVRFLLPVDHVVVDRVEPDAARETLAVSDPAIGERIGVDVGPRTVALYRDLVAGARTVVWNGPMGIFEIAAFARGTVGVAEALAACAGTTIVGGGDSVAALAQAGVTERITHVSTGGGASLEFLGGRVLPGVAALPDKPGA
jgi:phosphoglycerate kinase